MINFVFLYYNSYLLLFVELMCKYLHKISQGYNANIKFTIYFCDSFVILRVYLSDIF